MTVTPRSSVNDHPPLEPDEEPDALASDDDPHAVSRPARPSPATEPADVVSSRRRVGAWFVGIRRVGACRVAVCAVCAVCVAKGMVNTVLSFKEAAGMIRMRVT